MADITADELRGLAKVAGLRVLDEDVEALTLEFNALQEGLRTLDEHDLHGVAPIPALQYPRSGHTAGEDDMGGGGQVSAARAGATAAAQGGPAGTSEAPLAYKPIAELARMLRSREVSSLELTEAYLERVERFDGELRSYITVTAELAREQARRADDLLAKGEAGPLTGIPLAHKDEFVTKGIRTTCGSKILGEYVPDFDATVIERAHQAGAVMLGKLNMTEWASPLTWEFPFGQPRNPWNREHDAGGSSTGSGIAVAAGLCAGSIGEDTGGSIRRPASNNSCVGLRPSLGRVSVHGMFASSWYQDTAGPLARTVEDCALMLQAIAGHDPRDPMSADVPVPDYTRGLNGGVRGLRLGLVKEAIDAPHLNPEVRKLALDAVEVLKGLGATVEEVSMPLMALSGLINGALGSPRVALHWKYLHESPEDYDTGVRRYTLLPGLLPASSYQRALQMRSRLREQVLATLDRFDALLSPAYANFPPRIADTKSPPKSKEQAVEQMRRYGFHTPANFSGAPALVLPMGFSSGSLPIGLHIMGKRYDEPTVLRVGYAFEQATAWHTMRPPID